MEFCWVALKHMVAICILMCWDLGSVVVGDACDLIMEPCAGRK